MERRDFLRLLGVATAATLLPTGCALTVADEASAGDASASAGDASPRADASATEPLRADAPPPDAGPEAPYVIHEGFTVLLNDSSCSHHSHTVTVVPARYADD